MTHQEAIERVQKLLRLAKSDNVNEAATAMAMAQRVIDQHKLDVATLMNETEEAETIQDFRDDLIDNSTASWKARLAIVISKANGCKTYTLGNQGISVIGRKSEADTVRYMYRWLVKETERLLKAANQSNGRTWCNNFRMGVVDALAERLKKNKEEFEAQAKADGKTTALVRVAGNAEAVERWSKDNLQLRTKHFRFNSDASARALGQAAGRNINLGDRNGSLGAGNKQLGA